MSEAVTILRIRRLSPAVAGQIAAGEVIERPASVVKELVENSIDAGAGRVEIDVTAGGTQRIRVRDDGCGIHPDDLPLALESHATSKLASAADLAAIRSLGFRGEALASIAAVSVFELTSRIQTLDTGWRIRREGGGEPAAPVPAARAAGTTVTVDNLFQPVPARRRFLRSERTEFLHILETARRMALSQPDLHLQLRHNDKVVLLCQGDADYAARVRTIMGEAFGRRALAVERRAGGMHLWGWLGGRDLVRSQSDRQYFYLNGRMIRDQRISYAVRRALETEIPPGRYPSYVLHLDIDPAAADVNVHPTKQEVRFQRVRDVHDFIHAAIRDALVPTAPGREASPPETRAARRQSPPLQEAAAWYREGAAGKEAAAEPVKTQPLACVHGRYLLVRRESRVILLDAAAALRQSLLRRLQAQYGEDGLARRPLLVPVLLEVSERDLAAVREHREQLQALGLELDQAGPVSLRVAALPTLLHHVDARRLVREVLDLLASRKPPPASAILALLAEREAADALPITGEAETRAILTALEAAGFDLDEPARPGLWRTLEAPDLAGWLGT
jgi:DNA mismatch repair protein MutL